MANLLEYLYSFLYVSGLAFCVSRVNTGNRHYIGKGLLVLLYSYLDYRVSLSLDKMDIWFVITSIVAMIPDFLFVSLFVGRLRLMNLFYSLFYSLTYTLTVYMFIFFNVFLFKGNFHATFYPGMARFVCILLAVIVTISLFELLVHFTKQFFIQLNGKQLTPFLLLQIMTMSIIILFIREMELDPYNASMNVMFVLLVVQCVTMNVIFIKLWSLTNKKNEMELAQLSRTIESRYLHDLQQEQQKLREFRHDMRNHIEILENIHHDPSYLHYLENLKEDMKQMEPAANCGNVFLNACLNTKIHSNPDITFEVIGFVDEHLQIEDKDMCALLFNLLDNAIAAARESEEKKVDVKMMVHHDSFLLSIINSAKKKPDFHSHKGNGHGYGMKIIQRIVHQYEGEVSWQYVKGKVIANCLLPLKNTGTSVQEE